MSSIISGMQAVNAAENITGKSEVSKSNKLGDDFQQLLDKLTGGKMAEEIRQKYNVTLSTEAIYNYQQILDKYDIRCTNYVQIAPETLKRMETDEALKKKVMSEIEEFCSPESQAEMRALAPPVKSAGMIVYPDGRTLYWLEAYPNEIGTKKKPVITGNKPQEAINGYSSLESYKDDFTDAMGYYATSILGSELKKSILIFLEQTRSN